MYLARLHYLWDKEGVNTGEGHKACHRRDNLIHPLGAERKVHVGSSPTSAS